MACSFFMTQYRALLVSHADLLTAAVAVVNHCDEESIDALKDAIADAGHVMVLPRGQYEVPKRFKQTNGKASESSGNRP